MLSNRLRNLYKLLIVKDKAIIIKLQIEQNSLILEKIREFLILYLIKQSINSGGKLNFAPLSSLEDDNDDEFVFYRASSQKEALQPSETSGRYPDAHW